LCLHLFVCALLAPSFGAAQSPGSLDAVFSRMDQSAASFKGLTADIRNLSHTDVINKDEVDEGTIAVKRVKPKDIRILVNFNKTSQDIHQIGSGKYLMFNPKTREAREADLDKASRSLINQFMLLAFGSNSADLKSAYSIKYGGPDTVNGEKTTRIEMIPKDPGILKHIKRCDMWISEKGITLQQKFFEAEGDYLLTSYTNIKFNPNISDAEVKIDLPKGVKPEKLK
jgi:outer membrane lipoprotein-sorting protein